ncbi:hypothetical protein [Allomuricauda sp. F6463D]|uniref:hypothetical protein n=1 Tax=Allomuricauda sp. F6463D TaxID=2926409 RepID=UPI001FF49904|nr:hypothetical protein [Muricauda sp. F6463D]MCK0162139.1 hypothetical protein [Muricauda sp. F6463D]
MKDNLYHKHVRIAVIYFGIAALLGVLLRSYSIFSFEFNYKYIVHAHSHIALLGWVYVALTTLLHYCFIKKPASKSYKKIFWATQITLIGMLLTFPFQGYALFSIIFSTLFLIVSYIYAHHFWKNIDPKYKHLKSVLCAKTALIYMVISSIGPWALGAIMSTLGAQSIWYRLSIYFYLHFQYNGWMILALVGLFIYGMEQRGWELSQRSFAPFFWSLNTGIVLTFFLSTLWTEPTRWLYILGGFGAILQLYAFILLWMMVKNKDTALFTTKIQQFVFRLVIILGAIKIMLQLLTALPYFARMATTYLDLTIGYLHLTFLGVISLGLFLLMDYSQLFRISKTTLAWYLFGFLFTEVLIFYKGLAAFLQWDIFNHYSSILTICSLLILFGLLGMIKQNLSKS